MLRSRLSSASIAFVEAESGQDICRNRGRLCRNQLAHLCIFRTRERSRFQRWRLRRRTFRRRRFRGRTLRRRWLRWGSIWGAGGGPMGGYHGFGGGQFAAPRQGTPQFQGFGGNHFRPSMQAHRFGGPTGRFVGPRGVEPGFRSFSDKSPSAGLSNNRGLHGANGRRGLPASRGLAVQNARRESFGRVAGERRGPGRASNVARNELSQFRRFENVRRAQQGLPRQAFAREHLPSQALPPTAPRVAPASGAATVSKAKHSEAAIGADAKGGFVISGPAAFSGHTCLGTMFPTLSGLRHIPSRSGRMVPAPSSGARSGPMAVMERKFPLRKAELTKARTSPFPASAASPPGRADQSRSQQFAVGSLQALWIFRLHNLKRSSSQPPASERHWTS